MNKKITVATALVLVLFAVLLTFQITYSFVEKEYQDKVDSLTKTQSDFSKLAEADGLIREYFYGSVNENDMEDGLIKGYVSALADPYSQYLTKEEYESYQKQNSDSGCGIGARLTYDSKKKEIVVYTVFPSSPAQESGIKGGDVLYKIEDQLVSDLGFYEAIRLLGGEPGTTVNLTMRRRLATQILDMEFSVTREELPVSTVSYEILSGKIGYVQIFDFTERTAQEFSEVLGILGGSVNGIVFDVRNTSGTNISATCKMLDQLLPKGILVRTLDRAGKESVIKSDDASLDLPMCVLVNSATACSAELFAAALKDYEAATIVGETTYGKGIAQTVVELDDGSAMILSNNKFLPPYSPSFDTIGVVPDLESKLKVSNLYLADRDDDNQLQDAISALGI